MIDKLDHDWLEPVRRELTQSVDALNTETRTRLARIRQQALARACNRRPLRYLLPAAVLASAGLALAVFLTLRPPQPAQNEMLDDLDLITSTESLELIENLEFYEWLEEYDLSG